MVTYDDFCKGSSGNWLVNADARAVFDFLCQPENIHRMIVMSELGLPALGGVVKTLESKFANIANFPLSNFTNRQTVGKMVKRILREFGYEPVAGGLDERTQLRNFMGAELFKTSSVYAKTTTTPVANLEIQIV